MKRIAILGSTGSIGTQTFRKKQQKKLQAPQKKHRLLRIVKFLHRKKAK